MIGRMLGELFLHCLSYQSPQRILGPVPQYSHRILGPVPQYSHPVEDIMMDALRKSGLYVHWGVYMSGKSRAALNAKSRLQAENRMVIHFNGFDFAGNDDALVWLRRRLGVPEGEQDLSKFFKGPACVIIDHFEWCMYYQQDHNDLLHALRETGVGVLLLVSSWERAMELRGAGCELLGNAGCGRWKAEELEALRTTLGMDQDEEIMKLSILSGTPMYLTSHHHDRNTQRAATREARRAVIQDIEWRKGILALEQGVIMGAGTFPDRDGYFHWGDPSPDVEMDCSG